jgi:hypothetical protein
MRTLKLMLVLALAALDAELKKNPNSYFSLKMNGAAFEFDRRGRIVQGRVYGRTGFVYRNRPPGGTLAGLYPQIIEWFEKHN